MGSMNARARFAEYAAALVLEEVPDEAVVQARRTLLDTIGTAIGGRSTESALLAARTGGEPFGALVSASSPASVKAGQAFSLAVAASALDFDDGHYLAGAIHPASTVVPTLIVAAAGRDLALERLLTAQVAGYEVGLRLAHLLWPTGEGSRYHCSGAAAAVAGAVAAAKLDHDDPEVIGRAIEIAWSHAPMAALQFPMLKEAIGWAASTATFAAHLADLGWKRYPHGASIPPDPDVFPPTPFDEEGASDDPFISSLGDRFESAHTYLKPYSCCRYTHTAAAALAAEIEGGLGPGEIESIVVGTHRGAQFLDVKEPPTLEHAQYSFPFVLGSIAVHGDAGPKQISAARLKDAAVLDFAGRVEVTRDEAMEEAYPDHYAASLAIEAGGITHRVERVIAPGDTEDPLTETQLLGKFEHLTGNADEVADLVLEKRGTGTEELIGLITRLAV